MLVYHLYLCNATAGLVASTFSRNFEPVVERSYFISLRFISLSGGYYLYLPIGIVSSVILVPLVAKGGSVDVYTKLINPFGLIQLISVICWVTHNTSGWFLILDIEAIGSIGFTTRGILGSDGIAIPYCQAGNNLMSGVIYSKPGAIVPIRLSTYIVIYLGHCSLIASLKDATHYWGYWFRFSCFNFKRY